MPPRERSAGPQPAQTAADLGIGLGLRCPHYAHLLSTPAREIRAQWFEATSENYFGVAGGTGGRPLRVLEKIRENFPVVLHGVSLSIGSTTPLDPAYIRKLKALVERIEPALVSDHFCWTGVDGKNLHDLLPLPYTAESVDHLVDRIDEVQETLGRRMLFENVSSYLTFRHSTMSEWDFISEISRRSGCGILLDVNNIHVSSVNHGYDPADFLEGVPREQVGMIHLAGHSEQEGLLIDTHDQAVPDAVWSLYREAVRRFGPVPTMIERDANIPSYPELEAEAFRAKAVQETIQEEATQNEKSPSRPLPRRHPTLDEPDHHRSARSGTSA